MRSTTRLNITVQLLNGHKYSVFVQQDFELEDFIRV